MYIKEKGNKTIKIDNKKALLKDCKLIERISKFGGFILSYILYKAKKGKDILEIKRLFNELLKGYELPKNYSLVYSDKIKMVSRKGKYTRINIKAFNKLSRKK
jgi:hypothetical protein